MAKTGAELLIESLVEAGVNHLFSLSGNHGLLFNIPIPVDRPNSVS